jgi:predicted alpha/beta hydrolase
VGRAAVIGCGGGISAVFYRRFATYLAENGIPALTFDYRGIGSSRPKRLRGYSASVADWSEYDCGGAIAWLRERYADAELIGIAHSIGTLLIGSAPNAHELSRIVLICPHTGYFGDYRPRYRLPMAILWHGLMPGLTRLVGYFPANRLGLGNDLPSGIALEWGSRRSPDLTRTGSIEPARARAGLARCSVLQRPALVVSFTDDAFATDAGTRRLLSYFPKLEPVAMRIRPADAGMKTVGHFGFFRQPARTVLWPRVLAYIMRENPRGALSAG